MPPPKITILCIDDDPSYTELYEQILTPKGYAIVGVANPNAGYEAVKKHHPDLVILDVMMPERGPFPDGFSLLERLREDSETKGLPIVMISALGNPEDVEHGMKLGATSYLPKQEMLPSRLISEIEKLLVKD